MKKLSLTKSILLVKMLEIMTVVPGTRQGLLELLDSHDTCDEECGFRAALPLARMLPDISGIRAPNDLSARHARVLAEEVLTIFETTRAKSNFFLAIELLWQCTLASVENATGSDDCPDDLEMGKQICTQGLVIHYAHAFVKGKIEECMKTHDSVGVMLPNQTVREITERIRKALLDGRFWTEKMADMQWEIGRDGINLDGRPATVSADVWEELIDEV